MSVESVVLAAMAAALTVAVAHEVNDSLRERSEMDGIRENLNLRAVGVLLTLVAAGLAFTRQADGAAAMSTPAYFMAPGCAAWALAELSTRNRSIGLALVVLSLTTAYASVAI